MRSYNSLEKKKRAYQYLSMQNSIKNNEVLLLSELGIDKKLTYRGYDASEMCNDVTDFLEVGSTFVENYYRDYNGRGCEEIYNSGRVFFETDKGFDTGFEDEEVIDLSDYNYRCNYKYN